ncbi:hypothetical protein EMIT0194MI4_20119 [Pseudomonas sp. IT-194MI4]
MVTVLAITKLMPSNYYANDKPIPRALPFN